MAPRSELQELLKDLLGSEHVYFQPPETVKLSYPCIIYERNRVNIRHANDKPYLHKKRYQVMIIDRDPDSEIPDKVANLPLCSFDRFFTADNLNHDVYNLFF
jgi:hypothetical protein